MRYPLGPAEGDQTPVQLDHTRIHHLRRLLLVLAGFCGMVGLIIEYGTYPGLWALNTARGLSTLAVMLFLAEQVLSWRHLGTFRRYLRERWPTFALSVLLVLESLALLAGRETSWLDALLGHLILFAIQYGLTRVIHIAVPEIFTQPR